MFRTPIFRVCKQEPFELSGFTLFGNIEMDKNPPINQTRLALNAGNFTQTITSQCSLCDLF